jgi:hypothetical protein
MDDDDFVVSLAELTRENYLEWVPNMRSCLRIYDLWDCIPPDSAAEVEKYPDNSRSLQLAMVYIRRTFSEPLFSQSGTSKILETHDRKSLWAWLDKELVRRGVTPFAQYSILFRKMRMKPDESVSQFETKQYILQAKIMAPVATITPEIKRRINLYMALPDDTRYEILKAIWWHSWSRTTYQDMKWAIQDVLNRGETREKECEVTAQNTKFNENCRRQKQDRRLHT